MAASALLFWSSALSGAAFAADSERDRAQDETQLEASGRSSFVAQPSVSAAQAAARARKLLGGRVLSVNPSRRGDSLGYRVRVLVDGGRVKTLYVRSGQTSAPPAAPPEPPLRTIGDG